MFRTLEDNPNEIEENVPEEGPVPIPPVSEMTKASNWVHHTKSILKCNRVALLEIETPENEDPEVFMKKRQEADPSERRLKSIVEDSKVKGNVTAWSLRGFGD